MNVISPIRNASVKPPWQQVHAGSPATMAAKDQAAGQSKFAITILCVYIFLLVSRVLDVSPIWFLHIPMILYVLLICLMFAKSDLRSAFSSKIVRFFAAFTGWVLVCFPFSEWRGGSIDSVISALQSFGVFLIITQLVKSEKDWRKVAGAYAYAVLMASILSFYVGRSVEGRLSLAGGTLADPNEFAMFLVIGMPLWWMKASRASGPKKILFQLCTVPIFITFARTGSRAGLLALATVFVVMVIFARMSQKVLMVAVAGIALVAGLMFLPEYLKIRYITIFSPGSAAQLDEQTRERLGASIDSSEGRKMLLQQSITMTFEHPLLGVGPGLFAASSWDERKATTGVGGQAFVSHNTYTQISSETGIPGFFLFVVTWFLSLRYTYFDYRRIKAVDPDMAKNNLYLFTSLTGLSVGIFFLSIGYTHILATMFALANSLHIYTEQALNKAAAKTEGARLEATWKPATTGPRVKAPGVPKPAYPNPGYSGTRRPNRPPRLGGPRTIKPSPVQDA